MSLKVSSKLNIPGKTTTWNAGHPGESTDMNNIFGLMPTDLGEQADLYKKTIMVKWKCYKFQNYDLDSRPPHPC